MAIQDNWEKVSPITSMGTPELAYFVVDMGEDVETNYELTNSLYSQAVQALQLKTDLYMVSVPDGSIFTFAARVSSIPGAEAGATSGTIPASQTLTGDTTTTIAINPGTLAITRGVLTGWNTRADGTGTTYPGGQTGFSYNGNVTLYAMWGPATCTPTAGYTNCAVFPLDKQDLFYTLPANVPVGTLMQAEIWGAGGGVNESSPTGGGGGGYSKVLINVQKVSETFTIVTGDGGVRGGGATYGGGGAGAVANVYVGGVLIKNTV
jgi:hypothetical protein